MERSRQENPHIDSKIARCHELEHRHFLNILLGLPPAHSKQKKGRWIPGREIARQYLGNELINVEYENYHCSECGHTVENLRWNADGELMDRYCPWCGADMREEQDV